MQADLQGRKSPCSVHGICRGLPPHHQARSGEKTSSMGLFDRFVHRPRKTKVIAGDDQSFHDVCSLDAKRPSRARINSAPRQVTVFLVKAKNQETRAMRS